MGSAAPAGDGGCRTRGGTDTADVFVYVSSGPLPEQDHVAISPKGTGYLVVFHGTAGTEYLIQRSTDLGDPDAWVTISIQTVSPSGFIEFHDGSPPAGSAFYRVKAAP